MSPITRRVRVAVPAIFAAAALAVGTYATTKTGPGVGETSASVLVRDYLQAVADTNGFAIVREKLLAYRTDGNESVARVTLTIEQPTLDPYSGAVSLEQRTLTIVVRFEKSPWQVQSVKLVD